MGKLAAVLEFFTSEPTSSSGALSEVMEQIGVELGQVFERKWAERKLRESERLSALGITTAIIVHEIANPLQLVSGLTHLLQRQLNTEEEKKEAIELVNDLNNEIGRLISLLAELRFASSPGLVVGYFQNADFPLIYCPEIFFKTCLILNRNLSSFRKLSSLGSTTPVGPSQQSKRRTV